MKKRLLLLTIIGMIALVTMLAVLPMIVSTDTVKERAVEAINKRIPGRLAIAQWSLHWFGGIQLEEIDYEDANRAFSVRIDQVSLSKGLFPLMLNYREPGRIELLNPHSVIQLNEKKIPAGEADATGKSSPGRADPAADGEVVPDDRDNHSPKEGAPVALPPIVADLKIAGGQVDVVYAEKKEAVIVKDLKLDAKIDAPDKPLTYRLLARAGQGEGRISGQGSLNIPWEEIADMGRIRSDADLTIADWEMAPLLAIASAVSGSPMGEGRLNGRFQLKGAPASGIGLTGQLVGTDVRLAGNGLKGDTPFIKKMTCDIDAVQTGSDLTVNQLKVDSAMGKGFLNGRISRQDGSRFDTEVVLNLAQIFSQLPNTLGLKTDTKVTDGLAALKAVVALSDGTTLFDGHLHLDRLAGISGGKHLAWDKPFEADAKGSYGDAGIHLDNFVVRSSFLSGEGQGNLDNLQVRLNADIRTALKEAGKFIDTKGWKGNGQMNLTLAVGTRPGKSRFIEADLNIDRFQLNRQQQAIVPKNHFASHLTTDFTLDGKSRLSALSQTSVDLDTWMGKTHIVLDRLEMNPDGKPSLVKNFSTQGAYDLKSLSTFIDAFYPIPADTTLSGKVKMDGGGHFDGKTVSLETAVLGVKNFTCRFQGNAMKYNQVDIKSQGTLHPGNHSIDLSFLEIDTGKDNLRFSPLKFSDWSKLASSLTTQMEASISLTNAWAVMGGIVPASVYPRGRVHLNVAVEKAVGSAGKVTGKVASRDFAIGGKMASPKPRPLNILFQGAYTTDQTGKIKKVLDSHLEYNTWLGKGRIDSKEFVLPEGKALPRFQAVTYGGTVTLEPLSELLRGLDLLPGDTNIAGLMDIRTKLYSKKEAIAFEETTLDISEFAFRKAKRRIQDKKIRLHTKGKVKLKLRTANFNSLKIETTAGNVVFPELSVRDWADMARAVKGNGRANLDLAALVQLLESYLDLPKETKIAGQTDITFKADLTDPKKQILNLNSHFAPLKVDFGKGPLLDEKQADLSMALEGDRANGGLSVKQMALSTQPLSIYATGRVITKGQEQILTADGDLGVDLDRLQNPLNKLLGTDIALNGKSKRPFSVRVETEKGKWQNIHNHADLATALYADRISGFGLALTSVDIPLLIDNNRVKASITGKVNEGELVLQPTMNLESSPPVLSLPEHSEILTDTQITKEMANELLSLIHPVFKGTMAAKGKVDLIVQTMSWPVPESAWKDARFDGVLSFKDVRLNTEGLIYDLLAAMKVKERDVFIGERTVEFSCRKGRVKCSPLRISVKGYRMEVSGTMGLDGSLDYMAKIPITPEIVGDQIYPYVKGTTFDIPIGGTVSHPKLNLAAFDTVVQKMIQQAGRQALEQKAGDLLRKLFD